MASIGNDSGGLKRILFVGKDGKRRTIRLGKASMKTAETVKVKVESLVTASFAGSIDDETARWLAERGEAFYDKLAAVGLAPQRQSTHLGVFLDQYIQGRADVKPSTANFFGHTRRCLVAFFGADKPMREVTAGDADNFRVHLTTVEKLADNTTRRRMGISKQFFRAAIRRKLLTENPFDGQPSACRQNAARFYFVTVAEAQAVLDTLPSAPWRLLFALCRYGGLRCPSEVQALKWGDIDWARDRFTIHSTKTEHHDGGGIRVAPIFPELLPYLREAYDQAAEGDVYCCPQYVNACQMYRKIVEAAVTRAGLTLWAKLFQNLRSTRETELCEKFPIHVVTKWLGNSPNIAIRHYMQVTDDHYKRAVARGTESGTVTAQNAAQQPAHAPETIRNASQTTRTGSQTTHTGSQGTSGKPLETRGNCEPLREDASSCEESGSATDESGNATKETESDLTGRYRTRTYDLAGVIRTL